MKKNLKFFPKYKTNMMVFFIICFSLATSSLFCQDIRSMGEYIQSQQLLSQLNYNGAIQALQPLLQNGSVAARAKVEIGNIRKKQAENEMSQAMGHYFDAANYLSDGVESGAVQGPEGANILYDLGKIYEEHLINYPKAIDMYSKLLADYPSFLAIDQATYRLASCNERIANFDGASKAYQDIVTKFPYSSYHQIAQQRMKALTPVTNDLANVIEIQENVVDSAKTDKQASKASMDLASMYYDSGDFKKAAAEYKRVAGETSNPDLAREAMQKAAAILDEKEKDYKGAAKMLTEMVDKYPNEPETAKSLYKLGRIYEENLQEFNKKTRDGKVYLKQSDENVKKAITYYDRITENNSDADISADAFLRKGELYEKQLKDPDSAKSQYEEFLKQFPNHKDAEKIRERLQKLDEE